MQIGSIAFFLRARRISLFLFINNDDGNSSNDSYNNNTNSDLFQLLVIIVWSVVAVDDSAGERSKAQ